MIKINKTLIQIYVHQYQVFYFVINVLLTIQISKSKIKTIFLTKN